MEKHFEELMSKVSESKKRIAELKVRFQALQIKVRKGLRK